MKRLFATLFIVAAAFGFNAATAKPASAGGISFGIGIGSPGYYGPRYYRPRFRRYYGPRYRRYYRPRYVAPRYYRPRYRSRVVRRGLSRAHYRYCLNRYRSYRVSDNTFQPYNGRRRQCRSRY